MALKGYFMIEVEEELCRSGYRDILRDLETIPEVRSVERVVGACDLLVKVVAPIRVIFVANKIRAKKWVKNLRILHVESTPSEELEGLNIDDLIWLKKITPTETT